MKILKAILALLFIAFAALQYNDPDPWLWILIYGITALLFVLDLIGIKVKRWALIAIIGGVLFSVQYVKSVYEWATSGDLGSIAESMQTDKMYIEETREFFGLWIAIFALIFLHRKAR